MAPPSGNHLVWAIAAVATAGVIFRPWKLPEAVWAVSGALLLPLLGLLPWQDVGRAVAEGTDVYLFLVGMMLLAELDRREGLFDYAAGVAVRHARGSAHRLFALVYAIGVVVTVLLSNDATAVVLTPAVYAVCKKAKAKASPIFWHVRWLPMQPASCCPSLIRPTWSCSEATCRRCCSGSSASHCPHWPRSQ